MLAEAFECEDFRLGFYQYAQSLERSLEFDNNKKIDKFVKFIETAMKKNSIKVRFLCELKFLFYPRILKSSREFHG